LAVHSARESQSVFAQDGPAKSFGGVAMKTISILLLFALSATAYGQDQSVKPRVLNAAATQPDTSGERLKQLLSTADALEKAGNVAEAAEVRQKVHQERDGLLARIDSLQTEIDRLRQITGGVPQVIVHLKVYEVSLTKLRQLGYNLAKMQGKPAPSPDAAKDTTIGGFSVVDDGSEASRFFETLRKDNLAKVIAEPSLTTLSGCKASFNTGGKLPLPKPEKNGTTPVDWDEYGTQVEFTPLVIGDHRVRLSIHFRAAEIDTVNVTHVGKETVPGIRVREFTTVAECNEGQMLTFTGLNTVHMETSVSGVPIASSIPYIGSAFKNVKEERNEMAMFVLVRPELVQPASDADNAPATARAPSEYDPQR
jgi:Flp pilus assembly secretin CpaC